MTTQLQQTVAATDASNPRGLFPASGEIVEGRYRITSPLGSGGMGFVFEARHVTLGRRVALKVLSPDLQRDDHAERFLREARSASAIEHPCVVEISDFGHTPTGNPFFVMEHLEGQNLGQFLRAEGPLRWSVLGPLALQVCGALHAAHEAGVIHRDIKPENLFLLQDTLHLKVLDFGIAKVIDEAEENPALTGVGAVLGTADYLSPETVLGETVDRRTDIYSLGVSLYQLLSGRLPHEASSRVGMMMAHAHEVPAELPCRVRDSVRSLVMRCLEKRSEDRFRDARELFEVIRSTLDERAPAVIEAVSRSKLGTSTGSGLRLVSGSTDSFTRPLPPKAKPEPEPEPTSEPQAGSGRKRRGLRIGAAVAGLGAALSLAAVGTSRVHSSTIDPQHLASFAALPEVIESPGVTLDERRIELGRQLFADPMLSGAGDLACTSCHPLERYGADGLPVARGHNRQTTGRNVPSVYNAAGHFALGWSGAVPSIEEQARVPILDPREMANTEAQLLADLRGAAHYPAQFEAAFPDAEEAISVENLALALGAYQRTLVTPAPWDQLLTGRTDALDTKQRRGFNAFVEVGCVQCHSGQYLGGGQQQKLGLLRPWPDTKDRGLYEDTQRDGDWMMFKVASLRNVAQTGPYFHDGSIADLHTAVRMMAYHQLDEELDETTVDEIVSFLGALTGELPGS